MTLLSLKSTRLDHFQIATRGRGAYTHTQPRSLFGKQILAFSPLLPNVNVMFSHGELRKRELCQLDLYLALLATDDTREGRGKLNPFPFIKYGQNSVLYMFGVWMKFLHSFVSLCVPFP